MISFLAASRGRCVAAAAALAAAVPMLAAAAPAAATATTVRHKPPAVSPGRAVHGVHRVRFHFRIPPNQADRKFAPGPAAWPAARSVSISLATAARPKASTAGPRGSFSRRRVRP